MLEVNIKKSFKNFSLISNFKLPPQKVLGLLGGSGEGKSLTLRCIAGIDKPDSGYIRLNGKTLFDSEQGIDLVPQERHIGYLFPHYSLFPTKTVTQNILSGLIANKDLTKEEKLARVDKWLKLLHLENQQHHKPNQLSNGQQQRTALARILINEPAVLLLDEPFSALDNLLKWQLQTELCKLLEQYTGSTILVTHDISEVQLLTDEVCIIDEGRTEPQITTHKLLTQPSTYAACKLTGCRNFSDLKRLGDDVLASDWQLKIPTEWQVPERAQSLALRNRSLRPTSKNSALLQAEVEQIIKTPHSTIYQLRVAGMTKNELLTMELDLNEPKFTLGEIIPLQIQAKDVLWCYEPYGDKHEKNTH